VNNEPQSSIDYLKELNPAQQEAVKAIEGPVMIIAGAGSGKTRVLTYRIAYMLQQNIDAFNILSLTFTNKAAKEMRHRIEKIVGADARNLWMGTFHSVFAKILRIEADKLGYPRAFTIYDTDDAKSLLKTIINEMGLDDKVYKPNVIYNRISAAKNALVFPYEYHKDTEKVASDQTSGLSKMGEIYTTYCQRCFKAGAMDFDDLLLKMYELLAKHPKTLEHYQHKFKYIMVDEYQDTNFSQYMILKMLAAAHNNICVVGDDAQSIYGFRGATIKNILNFNREYPAMKTFKLEQNYRSTQTIVNASGQLIKKNKEQIEKSVWTENDEGERIRIYKTNTDNDEGKLVADLIFEDKMQHQMFNKEFAILYRTNSQSRALEEALRKMNIAYRIYGGMSFYQRKEIKDLIAYLRLIVNPVDEEALKRVINYPARGIGHTTMDKIMLLANEQNKSLWEIIDSNELLKVGASGNRIRDFVTMLKSFKSELSVKSAYDVAYRVAKESGLLKDLYEDKTVEGMSRFENVEELLNGIKEFSLAKDESGEPITLDLYLQDIALLTDADKDVEDADKVTLMTIHASKGLEFPHIYLVGMEENLFPSQMALSSRNDLEEERRLFYVAITRAEKKVTLSFADTRFRFGQLISNEPSRFLEELPAEFVHFMAPVKPSVPQRKFNLDEERGNFKPTSLKAQLGSSFKQQLPDINFKPIHKAQPAPDTAFEADNTDALETGNHVIHQRFGKGVVTVVEGKGTERKAIIEFEQYGKKVLILRFAKLKIL
jgi:DNA helicase-2/ATP-dependent DNA helicase PcrA